MWPTYKGKYFDSDVEENRPLVFLAQFNCAEIVRFDTEHLLPDHGLLSFFCVNDIYAATNGGRVYWFEDTSVLYPTDYPADMRDEDKLYATTFEMKSECSYPAFEEYLKLFPDKNNLEFETDDDEELYEAFCDEFSAAWWNLSKDGNNNYLLGWPINRQDSQFGWCELASLGYAGGSRKIPHEVRQRAEESAHERWQLLLQLNESMLSGFCFSDGLLQFFISKEDLAARRFDRVWFTAQSS